MGETRQKPYLVYVLLAVAASMVTIYTLQNRGRVGRHENRRQEERRRHELSTRLRVAVHTGDVPTVRGLLGTEAEQAVDRGWIFSDALWQGHTEVLQLLLQREGYAPLLQQGYPVFVAADFGYADVLRLMLPRGAWVDPDRPGDMTALMAASEHGYIDIVTILLDAGANVNAVYKVPKGSNLAGMKEMPERGKRRFRPLRGPRDATTALMRAAGFGHIEIVKTLLAHGAKVDIQSNTGLTALAAAQKYGHEEIAQLLRKAGATE